jgi:hypothetical protein
MNAPTGKAMSAGGAAVEPAVCLASPLRRDRNHRDSAFGLLLQPQFQLAAPPFAVSAGLELLQSHTVRPPNRRPIAVLAFKLAVQRASPLGPGNLVPTKRRHAFPFRNPVTANGGGPRCYREARSDWRIFPVAVSAGLRHGSAKPLDR